MDGERLEMCTPESIKKFRKFSRHVTAVDVSRAITGIKNETTVSKTTLVPEVIVAVMSTNKQPGLRSCNNVSTMISVQCCNNSLQQ
jgi:hypothetical protein